MPLEPYSRSTIVHSEMVEIYPFLNFPFWTIPRSFRNLFET